MKKAEGLSLTTVVIAALSLLVLIVLSVIFVVRMQGTGEKSKDCVSQGGTCFDIDEGVTCREHGDGYTPHPNGICQKKGTDGSMMPDDTKICCIKIA